MSVPAEADFSRYARNVVCVDDVSVSNQPHCLTLVFLSACFYVSADLFAFTLSPQGGTATEQAGTAQRGTLLPSRAAFNKNK